MTKENESEVKRSHVVVISNELFMDALLDAYHLGHHATVEGCFCDDRDWSNVEEIKKDFRDDGLIIEGLV